jgi:Fe-S-cluster-containing dehydrogenase component/anaerobic selenocysteine-containing dehydrogenase
MRVIGKGAEFTAAALEPMRLPADAVSRRRFLGLVSASAALAAAACTKIDRGAIVPYTKMPVEIVPGVATYYASTFAEGLLAQPILVKTREGRPIHVEASGEDPASGAAPLRAIADVLGLYDPDRLQAPRIDGREASWAEAMARLSTGISAARENGKAVLLLTAAHVSPTRAALIEELRRALPTLRPVAWEPALGEAERTATRDAFGEPRLSRLHLDRADVIVSFERDLLGQDPDASRHIRAFAARRRPGSPGSALNRLWVAEGALSLTGSNADERLALRPSRAAAFIFALVHALHERHGVPLPAGLDPATLLSFELETFAPELWTDVPLLRALVRDLMAAGPAALVAAGPTLPPEAHVACALLNEMLGATGNTIDYVQTPPLASLRDVRQLLGAAARGEFAATLFWDVNPALAFPDQDAWKAALARIPLRARLGLHADETALDSSVVLPTHHWLESWGDHETDIGLALQQPTIGPLFDTRQGEDVLLDLVRALGGSAPGSYRDYLKARWQREVYPVGSPVPFERFWTAALHDGVLRRDVPLPATARLRVDALAASVAAAARPSGGLELSLSPGRLYDGRHANSGWLQELPHPVTKTTWGNPLTLAPSDASRLKLRDGDVVTVSAGSASVQAPVVVQEGQAAGVASLELGYGRRTGNVATGVGSNAFQLTDAAGDVPWLRRDVRLKATGARRALARTQEHHRMEGRDLARSWTPTEYAEHVAHPADSHAAHTASLYTEQKFPEHKWGMAIDLSACVGCSACVVACQSENNIAVVGPEQVARGREMHWLRIDRYLEGEGTGVRAVHQPMLCQQCDNAPCEAVCPANATTHSPDGLNQMTYNRCVGTRYCANNCPYKVRRFNFLDFTSTKKDPERLVFNPEVTVRPRGVMEKCTFCVQRIEDARARSKVEGRAIRDGEIRTACAAACPAQAIVFGDLNDPESKVSKLAHSNRGYKVLAELGVKPAVTYLADLRNPAEEKKRS